MSVFLCKKKCDIKFPIAFDIIKKGNKEQRKSCKANCESNSGASAQAMPEPEKKDNTLLYVGIGAAVLVIGVVALLIIKR